MIVLQTAVNGLTIKNGAVDSTSLFASGAEVTQAARGVVKSAGQLKGTNTNDDAAAGFVGEYVESKDTTGSTWSTGTGTTGNVTSIQLTAGDWDISFNSFLSGGTVTLAQFWIATASASSTGRELGSNFAVSKSAETSPSVPSYRVKVPSTTTYYLNAAITYSAATSLFYRLSARRVR